jgi:hypothetical protein
VISEGEVRPEPGFALLCLQDQAVLLAAVKGIQLSEVLAAT